MGELQEGGVRENDRTRRGFLWCQTSHQGGKEWWVTPSGWKRDVVDGLVLKHNPSLRHGNIIVIKHKRDTHRGEDFRIQHSFIIVSPALVRIIIVLTTLLTNDLIMAPRRKLAGLVPRNLKADWVFELWGLHRCREEDSSAHPGSGWGEQDNHILCQPCVFTARRYRGWSTRFYMFCFLTCLLMLSEVFCSIWQF